MTLNTQQVWFITGANKGLGAAMAKEALGQGHKVVATARNPESAAKALGNSPNLLTVKLDITDDGQVQSAVKAALEKFGRIDVLVNNAGYGLLGYFEEMSEAQIRRQMETNVFGTMNLTRAVLPGMRKQGSGWLLVVSSTAGIRALGGSSLYSASKFALEGWMEGMHIDLKPLGIQCMLIEPGPFRTDFSNTKTSLVFADMEIEDYKERRESLRSTFAAMDQKQPGDPAKLAKALITAMHAPNPPLRLVAGKTAVGVVDQYFTARRAEFEAWRDVSAGTDFE